MDAMINSTVDLDHTVDQCPETTNITSVQGLRAMLATQALLSLVALGPNALMILILARTRVFHINLRLLLGHLNTILFAYSLALLWKSLSFLHTLTRSDDICSLRMKLYECKLRELPAAFPNNALCYASLALCLERLTSTIRYKHYDKNGARPWLAIILIVTVWTAVLTIQTLNLESASRTRETPVCENMFSLSPANGIASIAPQIVVEICIVFTTVGIHFYNRHQLNSAFLNRSKRMSLSARFQIDQNVQLNRIVTPAMILESICYIPIMLLLVLIIRGYELQIETKVVMIHFSYIWKLAFACLQPLLGFYENPHLNKGLKKLYGEILARILRTKSTKVKVAPAGDPIVSGMGRILVRTISHALKDQEMYFQDLERQWSGLPVQSAKEEARGWCLCL